MSSTILRKSISIFLDARRHHNSHHPPPPAPSSHRDLIQARGHPSTGVRSPKHRGQGHPSRGSGHPSTGVRSPKHRDQVTQAGGQVIQAQGSGSPKPQGHPDRPDRPRGWALFKHLALQHLSSFQATSDIQ